MGSVGYVTFLMFEVGILGRDFVSKLYRRVHRNGLLKKGVKGMGKGTRKF